MQRSFVFATLLLFLQQIYGLHYTLTLPSIKDAWVDDQAPNQNFGGSGDLLISGTRISFFDFDFSNSSILSLANVVIESATLSLVMVSQGTVRQTIVSYLIILRLWILFKMNPFTSISLVLRILGKK